MTSAFRACAEPPRAACVAGIVWLIGPGRGRVERVRGASRHRGALHDAVRSASTMPAPRQVILQFNPERDDLTRGQSLRDGLSVAVQVGNTLWVANDETVSLERLSLVGARRGGLRYGRHHKQFPLDEYLRLPVPP